MHARHLFTRLAPLAILATVVVGCLPATNPWDPDTDPALQVPGTIRGTLAYPDRSNAGGIAVELATLPSLPAVASTSTNEATAGTFALEVQPGTYWVRASATGYEQLLVGPFTLRAGERLDIGRQTLAFAPANAAIGGTVTTGGTLPERGIKVTAAPLIGGGTCGAPVGEAVTDEAGVYLIDGLRPGTYVVVAFVEGATVALSPPATIVEGGTGNVDLAIRDGSETLLLRDPITGSELYTREPAVRVIVDDTFSWASEMTFSEDPTFATGTGWQTFTTDSVYPSTGTLLGLTRTVVYAKFRSPCATSPLYSAEIIYDDEAPLLFTARLEGVDGLTHADGLDGAETDAPLVVVPDTRQTLLLSIDAFDATGVRLDVFNVDETGAETAVGVFPDVPSAESLALVRHAVPIPVEEGLSRLRVVVGDIAGNTRVFTRDLAFRVLRDLKAPTAPVPAVTNMTVSGDTALVWLTERTCERDDGTTVLALVCEENPKEEGFFEVRGGPAFVDFTGFNNPPFAIPVFTDGQTEIEIRAVDEAGNPSVSVGNVVIEHVASRTLMTLPQDRAFAGGADVKLTALGATAFYEVAQRPGSTSGTRYPMLVAQPADKPNLSLDAFTSSTPALMRRLSWGCASSGNPCNITPEREAGPLASGPGLLSWLEYSGDLSPAFPAERRARVFQSRPNSDGRHEIASQPNLIGQNFIVDQEDKPAQNRETCATRGKMDCATLDAWAGLTQAAPEHLVVTPDDVVVSGVATTTVAIGQGLAPASTEVVNGPALIAMQITARASARLFGFSFELDVEGDQVLRTAAFRRYVTNGPWNASPTSPTIDAARLGVITTGTGLEAFVLPDDFQDSTQSNFSMLVGVLVPAGTTVTFAKRPAPVDDLEYSPSDPYKIDGLVVRSLTDAQPDSFTSAEIAAPSLRSGEHIVGALHIQDTDFLGTGIVSGITRVSLDGAPLTSVNAPASTLVPGETAMHRTVVRTPRGSSEVHIADVSQAILETPATCVALLEVKDEVTMRDLHIEGRGMLDDLYIHAFRSTTSTAAGVYVPEPVFAGLSYVPIDAVEADNCRSNVLQTFSTQTLTGNVSQDVISSSTGNGSGDADVWSGVGPLNAIGPSHILPMDADTVAWEIYIGGADPFGDADVFGEYGADPVEATATLYSGQFGNNEYIHAPNTGAGDVYVGVYGWQEPSGFTATAIPMKRIDTVDVPAGATLRVTMTGTGDADLYVRLGGDPTFYDWNCSSVGIDTSDEECDVTATTATTATVAVAYYGPSTAALLMNVIESTEPEVVATIPLGAANSYSVTLANTSTSTLYLQLDQDPATDSYECRTYGGDGNCAPSGAAELPVVADSLHIAVLPSNGAADYSITVELFEAGCERGAALRDSLGSYAEGTFSPGVYALTWGRNALSTLALQWPTSQPQVKRGPRIEGTGAVRFLGAPTQVLLDQSNLLVAAASASLPTCDLTLTFDARTRYTRLAIDDTRTFALTRLTDVGGATSSRLVVDEATAMGVPDDLATLVDFGTDRKPWNLIVQSGQAVWLETAANGFAPQIRAIPVDDTPAPAECEVLDLSDVVAPFEVTAVSRAGGLVVVGGLSATGGVVHVVALTPPDDDHPCHQANVVRSLQVDGTPLAVHSDGTDTFSIVDRDGTGVLLHFDARDVIPVFAGGNLEAIGFDVDGERLALAMSPTYSDGDSHLVLMSGASDVNMMNAVQVTRTPSLIHPTLVTGGIVALTRDATNALELRAFPPRAHPGVLVAEASAVLAAAPLPPENDRHLLTRTPMLAAAGTTLAVLGHAGASRTLVLYEMLIVDGGEDDVTATVATVFGPIDVPGFPTALSAEDGVVVLTYGDTSSVVVKRDGQGTWAVDDVAHGAGERVVGSSMGELLVFADPGPIFVAKPPTVLTAELRASSGTTALGLAADAYFHDFATVGTFVDGDLLLYDMTSTPGLLWRIDRVTGAFIPADGPHRPLLVGTEGIGASALPRVSGESVYYIRRGATGNALYRMQL